MGENCFHAIETYTCVLCAIEKYDFASMPLTLFFLSLAAIAVKSHPKSPLLHPSACSFPPCWASKITLALLLLPLPDASHVFVVARHQVEVNPRSNYRCGMKWCWCPASGTCAHTSSLSVAAAGAACSTAAHVAAAHQSSSGSDPAGSACAHQ